MIQKLHVVTFSVVQTSVKASREATSTEMANSLLKDIYIYTCIYIHTEQWKDGGKFFN